MQEKLKKIVNEIDLIKLTISEKDILNRIIDRHRWPRFYHTGAPSVERILPNGDKIQDFFAQDNWIDPNKFIDFYNQGFTFILSGVQYMLPEIKDISNKLTINFNKNFEANLYFSKGYKSVSFPKHSHNYDVIVKNVLGSSEWIVDKKWLTLKDHQALLIPRYTDHQVISIQDIKASITFNLDI